MGGGRVARLLPAVITEDIMAIHSLRTPTESHRALTGRRRMLALGVVLGLGLAVALAFLLSS
jgi:hypothetical protein